MKPRILALLFGMAFGFVPATLAQFTQQWARIYPSLSGQFAEAVDVQMDAGGNIYTLGSVVNDMLLIKYNPVGDTVWTRRVANSGRPLKFKLDQSGNPVIALGGMLRKYNTSGSVLWTRSAPGILYTMSLDSLDNVLVGTASLIDVTAHKYSSNGDSLWRQEHPASGFPTASTTDAAGNLYLAASIFSGGSSNVLVIKYTPSGDTAWVRMHDRMGLADYPNDIEVDGQGNVVVAGYSSTSGQLSGKDYAVAKYSSTGELLWQRHFNGPDNGEDQINAMVLDHQGNIHVTGGMTTTSGPDAVTMKLTPAGDSLWAIFAFSGLNEPPIAQSGSFSRQGDMIGMVFPTAGAQWVLGIESYNAWLHKYEEATARGSVTMGMPGTETIPMGLAGRRSTQDEIAVVVHRVTFSPPSSSIITMKFTSPITTAEQEREIPTSFSLHQNYPNPFNPGTTIAFSIPRASNVVLKIYNVLGHEVETLINGTLLPGQHSVNWDATGRASGVYFCRFTAGSYAETRKLLLMK